MEVKKTIKKVIALAAGATMVGTTIMGAMAASLASYPAPFVKDGKFDGMIVVGDQAKAEDVIGATDIAMSLQYSMTSKKTVSIGGSASTVVLEGDSWKAETSSKKLELGENVTSIQSSITSTDLNALADGTVKAKNTADYEQELKPQASIGVSYTEDTDNDVVGDFVKIANNANTMVYKLTFKTAAESDIVSTKLDDLEDAKISILGKEYIITAADYSTANALTLTLMGGAVNTIMEEGQTKTFTVSGKDYEVTVDYVGGTTDSVKFIVNGEVSKTLGVSDTDTVGGIDIGVRDIMQNEAGEASGGDKVEFYLGAAKVQLYDSNVTNSAYDGTMTVGEDTMNDVTVGIKGTLTGSSSTGTFSLEMIQLNYTSDDDFWLAKGETLSSKVTEPQAFINWDVKYEGLADATTQDISVVGAGDDKAVLKVTLADGKVDVPLAYTSANGNLRLGDSNNKLVISTANIVKDQYFILTTGTAAIPNKQGEKSYLLQYRGADSTTGDTTATLKFKNVATGETMDRSFNIGSSSATLSLGGTEFTIGNKSISAAGTDDFNVSIVTGGVTNGYLVTTGDALIKISDLETNDTYEGVQNAINVSVTEVDAANQLESGTQTTVLTQIGATTSSNKEVTIDDTDIATMVSDPDDNDVKTAMTKYGALVKYTSISSGPDKVEISWPSAQRVAQVFVTSGATTSAATGAEAGEVMTTEIIKIDVGASVLASEIAGEETKNNLILVGGPCANSAAAVIMGNPENCVAGFEAGKAKVKLYENSGKVAMLVAGATALDTRGASKFVAQYDKNKATFSAATDEIALTVTSLNSITASIPTKTVTTE